MPHRYIADYVFALPTVAFFMCGIGIFIIAHFISSILLRQRKSQQISLWRKLVAATRYLSYRGFHVRQFQWNSAPVGVLLLGAAGTIYFFCELILKTRILGHDALTLGTGMDLAPQPFYWASKKFGNSPPLATRSGWLALACMPFLLCV